MKRCRAAVLYEFNKPMVIEELEISPIASTELLVRMVASGVCHSDLSAQKGIYGDILPCVLGHEGAGVVTEVGSDVVDFAPGDHVVLNWKPACEHCRPCLRGKPNLCEGISWIDTGKMTDGKSRYSVDGREVLHFAGISTFAEYSVVDQSCAVKVANDLPLEVMSLVGCAVTTGAGAALNAIDIREGDAVAVIGCGGVGLSAIMGARIRKAGRVIAVDRSTASLELARAVGATDLIDARQANVSELILQLIPGGVDYSIEAVGRKETMELASSILARGGEAVLIGVAGSDVRVEITPFNLVRKEHAVKGSFYGSAPPAQSFLQFGDYYRNGQLPIDKMVKYRPLDEINEAMAELASGATGRTVIKF